MLNIIKNIFKKEQKKSAIVYYAKNISYEKVQIHDYIIVQPNYTETDVDAFELNREKIYAYVSVGEISKSVKEYDKIKPEWVLVKNQEWDSEVLDIRNPEYQNFLLKSIIEPIIKQGFKNLFFDTLDSYRLASLTQKEYLACENSLVSLIEKIHTQYPDAKLILNRGFEIIDRVYKYTQAVLFESYYFGLGSGVGNYKKVTSNDREWLDTHLDKIKLLGIDIIAVDYLDEKDISRAQEAIDIIKSKGMIAYVSNRNLNIYGKSS